MRARYAIAGIGESDIGDVEPGTLPEDLMVQASLAALEDAGLELADVDGVFSSTTQLLMGSISLAAHLGIRPRYSDSSMLGGAGPIAYVNHARAAIEAGLCDVALIAHGSTQRSVGRASASVQEISPYEAPYEPPLPLAAYALAASRHMHEYGTTPEQLAAVAVAAREWAQRNPRAWSRDPLTIEDVLAAPRVCDPLGVRDCCLVNDGGAAMVMVSADRARELRRPPALVLGCGEAHWHRHISEAASLTTTSAVDSGSRAFAEAEVKASEISSAQLYDAFTITPILFLEDLGFCDKGEGGPFVAERGIGPDGELPVNTNGGGLSYCHPGMYGLMAAVEAVREVRRGRDVVLAHGNGGVMPAQATVVLGSEAGAS